MTEINKIKKMIFAHQKVTGLYPKTLQLVDEEYEKFLKELRRNANADSSDFHEPKVEGVVIKKAKS